MKIRVLGSAAGGGYPQWNCNCTNCAGLRNKVIPAFPRTQSSIAVQANNQQWILLNASPDIRQQLANYSDMRPQTTKRENCFAAIILLDSQIDHTAGLLSLREAGQLTLYSTAQVLHDLTHEFPLIKMLRHYGEIQHCIIDAQNSRSFNIAHNEHLKFTVIALAGKASPYVAPRIASISADNIAIVIEDIKTAKKLFYAPGLATMTDELLNVMQQVDCLLVDGTFWHDDEMMRQGVGTKLAKEMGHLALSGSEGLIAILNQLSKPRKILIHINNTNPILQENSLERHFLLTQQIEVAYDGMEIDL